jgi:putative heme iron utilization protein
MHHPKVSVLFIEDESQAQHLFARKRMTYACKAEEIGRDQPGFVLATN